MTAPKMPAYLNRDDTEHDLSYCLYQEVLLYGEECIQYGREKMREEVSAAVAAATSGEVKPAHELTLRLINWPNYTKDELDDARRRGHEIAEKLRLE